MEQDKMVKVQGISNTGTPEVVRFNGTTAVLQGQPLSVDFVDLVTTDGSEVIRLDEVKVATVNTPFGGIAAQAYAANAAGQEILVFRNKGDVCDALCEGGTVDIAVGNTLVVDATLSGLISTAFAGSAKGTAAVALEAYTTATTLALKKVVLTGEYSQVIAS